MLICDRSSGLWGFPGGAVENHETDIQALTREVFEETGLQISSDCTFIAEHNQPRQRRFYQIRDMRGTLHLSGNGDDVLACRFFDANEIKNISLAMGVEELIKKLGK